VNQYGGSPRGSTPTPHEECRFLHSSPPEPPPLQSTGHIPKMTLKRSRNYFKMTQIIPIWFQNDPNIIQRSSQNHSKMIPKWSHDDPEMIPKSCKNHPRIQNHPNIIPRLSQNHPKIIPKSHQVWSKHVTYIHVHTYVHMYMYKYMNV